MKLSCIKQRMLFLVLTAILLLTMGWAMKPVEAKASDNYQTFNTSQKYYLWLKDGDNNRDFRWNADGTGKGNVIHLDVPTGDNCLFTFQDAGNGYYGIKCTQSRYYVDTDENDKRENRVLHQYHDTVKQDNQKFRFIPVEGEPETYYIQVKNSGLYVGLNNNNPPEQGRTLVTASKENAWKWEILPIDYVDPGLPEASLPVPRSGVGEPKDGALTFMMNPLGYTRGISVHNDARAIGDKLHTWALGHTCKVTAEYIKSQGAYRLRSFDYFETTTNHWNARDFVWDVDGQSESSGAVVHVWNVGEEDKASTLWKFYPVPDMEDVYYILNVNSGKFVAPENGNDEDGVTLKQMWDPYPWEIHWIYSEDQTFHGYSVDENGKYKDDSDEINAGNWMSRLPDEMSLSQVNIPGTHDAASTFFYSTNPNFLNEGLFQILAQLLYLDEQLNAGVRAWDIRLSLGDADKYDDPQIIHGNDFTVCHNRNDKYVNLSQVLDTATQFLETHPGETIVMQLFGQGNGDPYNAAVDVFKMVYGLKDEEAEQVSTGALDCSNLQMQYPVYVPPVGEENSYIPDLGEVRGKIVLLNHLGVPNRKLNEPEKIMFRTLGPDISGWVSTAAGDDHKCVQKVEASNVYIQDVYNISSGSTKMDYVNGALKDINSNYETDSNYVLNFASAQDKWDISKDIYESLMRNAYLKQVDSNKQYTGILFCNEIDPLLARRIYLTNFSTDGTPLPVRTTQRTVVFADVSQEDYFNEPVYWAVDRKITMGVDDTHFDPDASCDRGQAVTFLWRYAGEPESETATTFADVVPGSYYEKAGIWAESLKIALGTGQSCFSPDQTCTREQIVTFLWRNADKPEPNGTSSFSDVSADAYYAKAIAWAEEKGIVWGLEDGSFGVGQDCTRGQIVTFLWRYDKNANQ